VEVVTRGNIVIEKTAKVSSDDFLNYYIGKGTPVVITDAMTEWSLYERLCPEYLKSNFGISRVPVCRELFDIEGETSLGEFIRINFEDGLCKTGELPYIRWFVRSSNDKSYLNSEEFFRTVHSAWNIPYFLPKTGYLFPFCPDEHEISPNVNFFPGQGLFISPKGARTRLHYDAWSSDAILCQFYGSKFVTIYSPEQAEKFVDTSARSYSNFFIDLKEYDFNKFPNARNAEPIASFELLPGEILYIPKYYLHEIYSLSNSISITWNFIHKIHLNSLLYLLTHQPWKWEVSSFRNFWFEENNPVITLPFTPPEKIA
jgi:hypothetical protein